MSETLYIVWDYKNDAAVRAAYSVAVGEEIQEVPEFDGQLCLVGSSRATPENLKDVPFITYGDTPEAAGFHV